MNTAIITKKVKVLATAVSLIALTSFGLPALAEQAAGLSGLGGAVGGVAGGVVGGLGKAVSDLSLTTTTTTSNTAGVIIKDNDGKGIGVSLGGPVGINADVDLNAKKDVKPKLKLTVGSTKVLKAKAGAKVLAQGDKANVVVPKAKPKAKVSAKVGTGGGDAQISFDNDGISQEIAGLSAYERQQLRRKCIYVLSSPVSFSRDAVQVCRTLAGL